MKVLLIWEMVPEKTVLYSLEGHMAELAIASAGLYVNAEQNASILELSDLLDNHEQLGHSEVKEAFDITNHDKVVIAGFIM